MPTNSGRGKVSIGVACLVSLVFVLSSTLPSGVGLLTEFNRVAPRSSDQPELQTHEGPPVHVASLLGSGALATAMGASGTKNWLNNCTPCALGGTAMTFDGGDGYLLLFGGYLLVNGGAHPIYSNATWKFSGGAWSQVHPVKAPSARALPGMTYDAADGYVVLVGGSGSGGNQLNDTWRYAAGNWTKIQTAGPTAGSVSLTYDSRDGYVLGTDTVQTVSAASTWKYSGGNWSRIPVVNQPVVYGAEMAFDTAASAVVLFGGFNRAGSVTSNSTWEYSGGAWTNVSANSTLAPLGRIYSGLTYDASIGAILVFGGQSVTHTTGQVELGDTWEFKGGNWSNVTSGSSPSRRAIPMLSYDPIAGYDVLFGGFFFGSHPGGSAKPVGDTWKFTVGHWSNLHLPLAPASRFAAAMAFDALTNVTVLFGGSSGSTTFGDTWEHSLGVWTKLAPGNSPTPRSGASMAFDPATGGLVLFGGLSATGTLLNDTWSFMAGNWTVLSTSSAPSAREFAAISYDSSDGYLVLFGGNTGVFAKDTWEFNGGSWTNVTASSRSSPAIRYGATLSDDPPAHGVTLFGGFSGSYLADTWTFKNGTWLLVAPLQTPSGRDFGALAFDPKLGVEILFGGYDGSFLADTWEYHHGQWTQLSTSVSPPPRELASIDFETPANSIFLFGGYSGLALAGGWSF